MNNKNSSITNIFLAVEFDEDTKNLFARKLFLLEHKDYLRLEPKKNLHITIGYISDVHQTQRRDIINAFRPLKELMPFSAHVESPIVLGEFRHMLCVQHSPYDSFLSLHNIAKTLLSENTEFKFNDKHPDFIPHTKLQTIRKSSGTIIHDMLIEEFQNLSFRKIDFKVKSLALMHRVDKIYEVLYRYELKKPNGAKIINLHSIHQ